MNSDSLLHERTPAAGGEAVVPDFIFGSLALDEYRLAQLRSVQAGVWHDQRLEPLDPRPGEAIRVTVGLGPATPQRRVSIYYTTDGSTPAGERGAARSGASVALQRAAVEWDYLLWGYRERWEGQIPPQPEGTRVRYVVEAWTNLPGTAESMWAGGETQRVFGFTVDRLAVSPWLWDSVIYQIFVDRFTPDPGAEFAQPDDPLAGFYGGTLRGITERLDYLVELGVTCIWLTPIFPSPTHHGYDATGYSTVEPRLGTVEDLDELVSAAHARGLRVILDYVANHLSSQHPAFLAARADRASETVNWFTFDDWPNDYRTFFGVRTMPKINTDDPGARAWLIDAARAWVARGIDGFRLDHAYGATHSFWSDFRSALREVNPDSVTLGEVVETAQLQRSYTGRMDGCLDFLLLQALRSFFAFRTTPPSAFDAFLQRHLAYFGDDFVLPSFLDNHDMNRFLWTVQGDKRRLRLAALCQFTLPGPPIVYYGSEVGMSQRRDVRYPDGSGKPEEARFPMLWDDDTRDRDLLAFFQALVRLRRAGGSDWRAPHRALLVDDARGLYAYAHGRHAVSLNNSPEPAAISLPDWQAAALVLATETEMGWESSAARLAMPAWSGACLRLDG